jgi:GntR family transcriptional regulator / MocR family aminotransferase
VATAATMGVRVNGLGHERFVATDAGTEPDRRPPALVLGFDNVGEHQVPDGIRTLAGAVRRQGTARGPVSPAGSVRPNPGGPHG